MSPNDNMASELLSLKPQRDRQGGGQEMMDGAARDILQCIH